MGDAAAFPPSPLIAGSCNLGLGTLANVSFAYFISFVKTALHVFQNSHASNLKKHIKIVTFEIFSLEINLTPFCFMQFGCITMSPAHLGWGLGHTRLRWFKPVQMLQSKGTPEN